MRYIFHRQVEGSHFKVEFWRGDDQWKASLHVHWKWRGKFYWFCLFLPEWLFR